MGIFYEPTPDDTNKVPKETKAIKNELDRWEKEANTSVIDNADNMKDLQDEYDNWIQQTYKQRKISNDQSNNMYGMNNIEHFETLRHKFLNEEVLYVGKVPESDKIKYTKDDVETALRWSADSMNFIITPQDNLEALENLWKQFNTMTTKRRRDSDARSIEIFGMDNTTHYDILKGLYLQSGDQEVNTDTMIKDTPHDAVSTSPLGIDIKAINQIEDKYVADANKAKALSTDIETVKESIEGIFENYWDIFDREERNMTDITHMLPEVLPYYYPDEMINMGIMPYDVLEGEKIKTLNKYDYLIPTITVYEWFVTYYAAMHGIITENFDKFYKAWKKSTELLSSKYELALYNEDEKAIKVLEDALVKRGWNPDIKYIYRNHSDLYKDKIQHNLEESESLNMFKMVPNGYKLMTLREEALQKGDYLPLYIILVQGSKNLLSDAIQTVTKSDVSHAGLALNLDLNKIYSFNFNPKDKLVSGFSTESIDRYIKNNARHIEIYGVFLHKKAYNLIKDKLEYWNKIKSLGTDQYAFMQLFNILIGHNVIKVKDTAKVCSQFVAEVLKTGGFDIVHKKASMTSPADLKNIAKVNPTIYQLWDGSVKDYKKNIHIIRDTYKGVLSNAEYLREFVYVEWKQHMEDAVLLIEAKSFPIEFDKDGNLFLTKFEKMNYDKEYANCHTLLMQYDNAHNYEGMKYELSKLWAMNLLIEEEMRDRLTESDRKHELTKSRAHILNDFKKYMKVMLKANPEFNFSEYYEHSPFSTYTIKITNHTLRYSGKLLNKAIKSLLYL